MSIVISDTFVSKDTVQIYIKTFKRKRKMHLGNLQWIIISTFSIEMIKLQVE